MPGQAKPAPVTDNSLAFPWEQRADSQSEAQAVESLFENPGPELEAVLELSEKTEKPKGSEKPAAEDEDEESEESDESEDEDSDADEDEESEDESADQESEDESDGDEQEDGDDDADLIEVTLPGGEKIKVTREEAAAGYSRTADYTRKRQHDVNEHNVAMQEVRAVREQYDGKLAKLGEILEKLAPAKPDAALRKTNPGEYAAQKAEYDEYQEQIAGVGSAREEVSEERKQELIDWRNDRIAEAREKLVEVVPEWKDPTVSAKDLKALGEFLQNEWGFTEQELQGVVDHRLVLMARENMRQRQATTEARKKIGEKREKRKGRLEPGSSERRPAKSGSRAGRKDVERARLASQTGHVRDVARSIELEFGDEL